MQLKTRYDRKEGAAIITEPREIKVAKQDYEAIETVTEGIFGYLFIRDRLTLTPRGRINFLNLSYLKVELSDLHPGLADLTYLRELNLAGNKLTELPEVIGELQNLRTLHIDTNSLETFPNCITRLKRLEKLYMGYNHITTLPEEFGNLTALRELYAVDNPMVSLPTSMKKMPALEYLVVQPQKLDKKSLKIRGALRKKGVTIVLK